MNSTEEIMEEFVQNVTEIDADERLEEAQTAYVTAVKAYHETAPETAVVSILGTQEAWEAERRLGVAAANAVSVRLTEPLTREQLEEQLRLAIKSKAQIEKTGVRFETAILRQLEERQKYVDGGFHEELLRECKAFKSHWPWGRSLSLSKGQRERAWQVLEKHCAKRPYTPVERTRSGVPLLETAADPNFKGAVMLSPPYQLRLQLHDTTKHLQVVPA